MPEIGALGALGAVGAETAVGADVGLAAGVGAADVGGAFGAASAADLAAATAVPDLTAATDITAGVGTFGGGASGVLGETAPVLSDIGPASGVLDTGFTGASTASDLVAGGSGVLDTGVTAPLSLDFGTPASGVLDFGGTLGDPFSAAGMGPATNFGSGVEFGQPFDQFATVDATGNPISSGPGSFGGQNTLTSADLNVGAEQPVQQVTGQQIEGGATRSIGGGNIVQSNTGVVQSQPISGGSNLADLPPNPQDFAVNQPVGTGPVPGQASQFQGLISGNDVLPVSPSGGNVPVLTGGGGAFPTAQPNILSPDFLTNTQIGALPTTADPNAFTNVAGTGGFTGAEPGAFLPTSSFDPAISAGGTTPTMAPGLGPAPVTASPLGPAAPAAPAAATPAAATPAATGATPAASAAGGGIDPLTGLRIGTAGLNAITAGINMSNALNRPSFSALQPISFPGSPAMSGFQPSFPPGTFQGGGITGGLAGNRLVNGLVGGASPQQLAQAGIISQQRATRLQGTYNDIVQQFAAELHTDPRNLGPGVLKQAAAAALADNGLGGR